MDCVLVLVQVEVVVTTQHYVFIWFVFFFFFFFLNKKSFGKKNIFVGLFYCEIISWLLKILFHSRLLV